MRHLLLGLTLLSFVGGCRPDNGDIVLEPLSLKQKMVNFVPGMGKGVDAAETHTFAQCVVFDEVVSRPLSFNARLYDERMIKTRHDLDESLGVDTHVKATGLWGKASGSASYFKNITLSSDSVFWLVNARYETESELLNMTTPAFGLTPVAKRLLQEQGIEAFTRVCGTHFYSGRIMGGRYSLLYEFKSNQSKVLEKIKAAATYDGFGIGADAEFSKAIQNALRTSSLTVHSDSEGGGHEVGDVATDPAELKQLLSLLRRDLADKRQGKPLAWEVTPYTLFAEVAAATTPEDYQGLLNHFKRSAIKTYYERYMDNQDRAAHIDTLLAGARRARPLFSLTPEHEHSLKALAIELRTQNDEIALAARACFERNETCSLDRIHLIQSQVALEPDDDMSGLGSWSVRIQPHSQIDETIDLWAHSDRFACSPRIFELRFVYANQLSGVYRLGTQDGWKGPIALGTAELVHDEKGNLQPNICLGENKHRCALRIVALPGSMGTDGCPAVVLELTTFNSDGSVSEVSEFNSFFAKHPGGAL